MVIVENVEKSPVTVVPSVFNKEAARHNIPVGDYENTFKMVA